MSTISPYTGWTREHWTALADRMLAAVEPYRSPGLARVDLPGPASRNGRDSDGLEGFARTFLLAGFRIAGEHGSDPSGLLQRYADGLAAGTDPTSPERWPRPDELDQSKVESASIALVLRLTRPWLWDRLDEPVRERVVAWLGTVIGQPYPPINWVWFRIVVESFLADVGAPWSRSDIEEDLAAHASFRRSGGWLSDGAERAYDHYTGWALHLYPLLCARLFPDLFPDDLSKQWTDDLARYLADAVCLVGADGSPLIQGRSLTYRFAAAAPFWMGAVTGVLAPGLARRAASGIVRHFADNGALDSGLLTLGWHREWPALRQSYSGPGSPYWAAKGMLGLMLPADHPVWTERELPLPAETATAPRVVAAPGWLVSTRDGIAQVVNHGTDHARPGDTRSDSPLYARLGYSTATFPSSLDNSVVLLDAAGHATHRAGFETLFARELPGHVVAAASRGQVRWVDTRADDSPDHGSGRTGPIKPGPVITVLSVVRDGVEVRFVIVAESSPDARAIRLGGWPVSGEHTDTDSSADRATARAGTLRSTVYGLRGFTSAGVTTERDISPLGAYTATPWLATDGVPVRSILAAAVTLDRGSDPAVPALAVSGERIELTWPDHRTTVLETALVTDPASKRNSHRPA